MDLDLRIKGDGSGAGAAFVDVASDAKDSADAIAKTFASMAKKTDTAFKEMERERAAAAKKSADEIAAIAKAQADQVIAANKKVSDALHEQQVQRQADYLDERKKAEEFWAGVGSAALAAGAIIVGAATHALKAYSESEQVQRQLKRAAGEYSDVLEAQAKALSKVYAVDDDVIMQSQTLMAQWGGAGAAAEGVEKAALNLAAAFHVDLRTATEMLIRNVESGGTGLAKMGVHFETTGNKGKDLAAAVEAINKKLGGAAEADANSLAGQARAAKVSLDDLEKGFGQLIAAMLQKSNAITWVRDALASYQELFFGNDQKAKNEAYLAMQTKLTDALEHRANVNNAITQAARKGDFAEVDKMKATLAVIDAQIAKLKELRATKNAAIGEGDVLPGVTGTTNKAMKEEEANAKEHATKMLEIEKQLQEQRAKDYKDRENFDENQRVKEQQDLVAQLDIETTRVKQAKKEGEDLLAIAMETASKDLEIERKREEKYAEMKHTADMKVIDEMYAQQKLWADAGEAIGMALVDSVSSALQKMMDGGDMDAGEQIANIVGDVLSVAGQVIGTAVGGYLGNAQLGGAIGGAAGGLAGAGVKALGRAGARERAKTKTYHQGGVIGDEIDIPRYHSGGALAPDEMHIIAQKGEHMISRQGVANMGGHAAVDAAANGGARFSFTIQTIDAVGTKQFFENDGGRGFFNALRTGRGALVPTFGGG